MASQTTLLNHFRTALHSFHASQSSLRILRTVALGEEAQHGEPSQLMVLDSSFNPPTKAHFHIATSALKAHGALQKPTRLILLLATQNADKPAQPASFEHRLCMMTLLADAVIKYLDAAAGGRDVAVEIGVTKLPYFVGKAQALSHPENYNLGAPQGSPIPQVHLIGYDTLIRIFDTKYYPPKHDLKPLQGLFDHHKLRVTFRADAGWGGQQEQLAYLDGLRNGSREAEGAHREWADRIELVESSSPADNGISSSRVRAAAKATDASQVRELCPPEVSDWILQQQLYTQDEKD